MANAAMLSRHPERGRKAGKEVAKQGRGDIQSAALHFSSLTTFSAGVQ